MAIFIQNSSWLFILVLSIQIIAQTTVMNSTTIIPSPWTPPPTHAPFPTASLMPLPPEFSNIPKESVMCWDSKIYYTITSNFLFSEINSAQMYTSYDLPTPIVGTSTYVTTMQSCVTSYPGLTTLCDGYPRASDCIAHCTPTSYSTSSTVFTRTDTYSWIYPTWSTELDKLEAPKCTEAPNLSPECGRLAEAYSWRVSQLNANGTATQNAYASPLAPRCSVFVTPSAQPTPSAKPKCSLQVGSYEAYYWPSQRSDPKEFCSTNSTSPIGTPTVTGPPSSAIISGLTMTSPYVYHVLHNVTIYTIGGYASSVGSGSDGKPVYQPSRSLSQLSLSQNPSSILSCSKSCYKPRPHGATRCTISFNPGFLIQDLFTVNAKNYYGGELSTPTTATICQESVRPTVALPLSDVAAQNGIAEECEWTWDHSKRTKLVGPEVITLSKFGSDAYHAITSSGTQGSSTGALQPGSGTGSSSVSIPTSAG